MVRRAINAYGEISIHALLAEGDRDSLKCAGDGFFISIHALLAEGDNSDFFNGENCTISIHALLAEGDPVVSFPQVPGPAFLSTPSLRRATMCIAQ